MPFGNVSQKVYVLREHENVKSFVKLVAKSGAQEDAFYVCDLGDFVRKYEIWKAALPRIQPHYAVKCNDSMIVLETLAALGVNFDCASKSEMDKVLSLGVKPERIVFANSVKPEGHIKHATKMGVNSMTFDNMLELKKIKRLHPHSKLLIRIKCDAQDAQCLFGKKFGCDPESEAEKLLEFARSLDLNVIGVSFHVGSGCYELGAYSRAIGEARKVFDMAAKLGYQFKILDIGGGYPGDYGPSFGKIAESINSALEKHFPDPSTKIIAEPGRFFVHTAFTVACNIYSVKETTVPATGSEEARPHRLYYINDGVFGSFNAIISYHEEFTPTLLEEYGERKLVSCTMWGPTCDGVDLVVKEAVLPELEYGEWVMFEEMGAYTISLVTTFNGLPVPKIFVVADERTKISLKNKGALFKKSFRATSDISSQIQQTFWMDSFINPLLKSLKNVLRLR